MKLKRIQNEWMIIGIEDFFDSLNKMIPVKENNITYQMYALPLANFDINSGEFSKKFDELINVID
nr:hypothetical protein [Mycoplasmopsis bovis]